MIVTLVALTADSSVELHLAEEDVRDFHALPPLPQPEPDDFEPPSLIVADVVTGRVWDICRFIQIPLPPQLRRADSIGCQCGCGVYAVDITESWETCWASEEAKAAEADEPIVAFTYGGGELPLTLAPEDIAEFDPLPRLPQEMPEDFEPPSVIVTDIVTGRTYWMARALCGLGCDCRAYAEDITES
jgi:hypothetical protein